MDRAETRVRGFADTVGDARGKAERMSQSFLGIVGTATAAAGAIAAATKAVSEIIKAFESGAVRAAAFTNELARGPNNLDASIATVSQRVQELQQHINYLNENPLADFLTIGGLSRKQATEELASLTKQLTSLRRQRDRFDEGERERAQQALRDATVQQVEQKIRAAEESLLDAPEQIERAFRNSAENNLRLFREGLLSGEQAANFNRRLNAIRQQQINEIRDAERDAERRRLELERKAARAYAEALESELSRINSDAFGFNDGIRVSIDALRNDVQTLVGNVGRGGFSRR